jgi:hypothetical protein
MNSTDRTKLLRETLSDDSLAALRTDSLRGGLEVLRARRRRRRLAVAVAGAAAVALFFGLSLPGRRQERTTNVAPISAGHRARLPPIEVITDEELLALFPTQTIALVGTPGRQELLFLDERPARVAH